MIEEVRRGHSVGDALCCRQQQCPHAANKGRDSLRWAALGLLWFEDPFWLPEDLLDCPALPGIVIGIGADRGSSEQMAVYSKTPAIGVLQPDVCMLGGLS